MTRIFRQTGALAPFILISMFAHGLAGYVLVGPFKLGPPVNPLPALSITLTAPDAHHSRGVAGNRIKHTRYQPASLPAPTTNGEGSSSEAEAEQREIPFPINRNATQEPIHTVSSSIVTPENKIAETNTSVEGVAGKDAGTVSIPLAVNYEAFKSPVRQAGEFLANRREKLLYRVTLLKVPVGSLEIEASNREGELRIVARIKSNTLVSGFYPVDDLVETRMINGNYLLTRVRQNEGNLRGDFGYTLMLREHKAFWVDRLAKRYDYQPLPEDDVTDALAGFYFLRNRVLEVGKTLQLHLFDGNEYFPAKVHVLRREQVRLADLRNTSTIVISPELPASGLFRKNHDVLVWLTDDENKVPVKLECDTPLGRVTAELVSSETEPARTSR